MKQYNLNFIIIELDKIDFRNLWRKGAPLNNGGHPFKIKIILFGCYSLAPAIALITKPITNIIADVYCTAL